MFIGQKRSLLYLSNNILLHLWKAVFKFHMGNGGWSFTSGSIGRNELSIWRNADLAATASPIIVREVMISLIY